MKTKEQVIALFTLAGIKTVEVWKIENQYWSDAYKELKEANPWWLVLTSKGIIELGPRKRVISLSWKHTSVRCHVTSDDTTEDDTMCHAWTEGKLIEYLRKLATELNKEAN